MEEQTKEMTFEAALARLNQIVRQLESNNVPLDDLMKLYDEGNEMIRFCNKKLEDASSKVKLVKEQNGWQLYYEEFTGEIAVVDVDTGVPYFSNPYPMDTSS